MINKIFCLTLRIQRVSDIYSEVFVNSNESLLILRHISIFNGNKADLRKINSKEISPTSHNRQFSYLQS